MTDVTFVDDFLVEVAVAQVRPPSDEYETDSEDDFSDREDEDMRLLKILDPGGQYAPFIPFPPGIVRYMYAYSRHLSKAN